MRFFKWKITTRVEKLDQNDKIIYLANQLAREILRSDSSLNTERSLSSVYIHIWDSKEIEVSGCKHSMGEGFNFSGEFEGRDNIIF